MVCFYCSNNLISVPLLASGLSVLFHFVSLDLALSGVREGCWVNTLEKELNTGERSPDSQGHCPHSRPGCSEDICSVRENFFTHGNLELPRTPGFPHFVTQRGTWGQGCGPVHPHPHHKTWMKNTQSVFIIPGDVLQAVCGQPY